MSQGEVPSNWELEGLNGKEGRKVKANQEGCRLSTEMASCLVSISLTWEFMSVGLKIHYFTCRKWASSLTSMPLNATK